MAFELTCYHLGDYAVPIEPARHDRAIFDANRHAYRCLPMTIANTAGWELLCPCGVTIEWDGGDGVENLTVTLDDPNIYPFAKSHFATGIVTFEMGWLFRTSPGVHLWAMGPPNDPKDGIAPLSGLIETDWIPYTFTMNWKMTRPGRVRFEQREPFCFITPGSISHVADCQPIARHISDAPEIQAEMNAWATERATRFNHAGAFGKRYFRGAGAPERHIHKLRAKAPMQDA